MGGMGMTQPRALVGWTFCSGIGAPEVALPEIDWRFASEIERFPRQVLQARFGYKTPKNHNQGEPLLWGDMTEVTPDLARKHGVPLPDLIVAGTPCQAFSIAGLRKGTEDPRGNLTLSFVRILHDIVAARPDGKLTALWENVPGVLSDAGNVFGNFLGGIVGTLDPIPAPAGGTWPGEGMVEGPRARAAWSVLDAQWFGVAQRRRRLFVVIDFGGACDPAAVLLEPDRLRGDTPPRRETGQGIAADAAPSITASGRGVDRIGETRGQDPVVAVAQGFGGGNTSGPIDVAATLTAKGQRIDFEVETFIAHTLRGEGHDAGEDGTGRGVPIVPVAYRTTGNDGAFETGDTIAALTTQTDPNSTVVAFDLRGREGGSQLEGPHDTANLRAASGGSSRSYVATEYAVRRLTPRECERMQGFPDDHTLIDTGKRRHFKAEPHEIADWIEDNEGTETDAKLAIAAAKWADELAYLRRTYPDITHEIAETLASDGPRYKAIGNSMAVPVIRWIGRRIIMSAQK